MPNASRDTGATAEGSGSGRCVRVVVADDHALSRRQLVKALERRSRCRVVGEAAGGREALARVEELAPDVALIDIRMPGMDGLEVARRIRAEGPTAVVLISANEAAGFREAAARAGASAFLPKSVSEEELEMAVFRAANEGRS